MHAGKQPFLKRNWADEIHTYLYFSYVDSISEPVINPRLTVTIASIFLIVSLLVFACLKRKWRKLVRTIECCRVHAKGLRGKERSKNTEGF